jgi:hypothetical protein|tara:strand:+ start:1702 stop:1914 length:213 start_codon:yes stop_codon:yes gene_type:complete
MIATKRKMKRKDLIDRVQALEYVLSNVITNARNLELIIDYYVEMKGDVEKFEKFLDKKQEDANSTESESK